MNALPQTAQPFMNWTWAEIEPHYQALAERPLTDQNVADWLLDWTQLSDLMDETFTRLRIATSQNTADADAKARYFNFLDTIDEPAQIAEQRLKEKLLASGLQPEGFAVPLRKMRASADLFREANVPLLTEEMKLGLEYDRIQSTQTVQWEGQETTLTQLQHVFQEPDRVQRETAWRLAAQRQLADRDSINTLWGKLMNVRGQIAANAQKPDYRAYVWQNLRRFDYTPQDCITFHDAIEREVVPVATRIYKRIRDNLGVESLRPWDLGRDMIYPVTRPPLHPFANVEELESKTAAMFEHTDPQLGEYFGIMRREHLLDADNRKNKAPGGNCSYFPVAKRPFIFINAVGTHDDVQTLLHEAGHAFHAFESAHLPYHQQGHVDMEFNEVASMAMELLAAPYLSTDYGGFYTKADAVRALIEHLEKLILFWPYMAVVDAFQHWVYENHTLATDAGNCDAKWSELWGRFLPGIDWSGLDDEMMTGWHRKRHIHRRPFYYIEYGLAQLGAVQVWRNALSDQAGAIAHYRKALALGGTVTLPELYKTAGATFAFDRETVRGAVALIEQKIAELQTLNA